MKKIDIDGLLALNLEEIEIVYRRCRGDSVQKVGDEMGMAPSTIWNQRMKGILKLLGVTEWREVEDELCIPLRKIIPSLDALKEGWPDKFRDKIEALREPPEQTQTATEPSPVISESAESQKELAQESVTTIETPADDSSSKQKSEKELKKRHFPPWPIIAILILVVCLLCIAAGIFAWNNFPLAQATRTPESQVPTPTATQRPTDIVPLSPTPSQTLTATNTTSPTDTALPTNTTTPSPVPIPPAAFFDDFENGLNPAWTVVYGNPVISNGQLQAGEATLLSVGDPSWTNYQVEFDVKMGRYTCQDEESSTLGIRASDMDNMLMLRFHPCETEWSSVVNGNRTVIPGTFLGNQNFPDVFVHFIITAEGNKITFHEKSNLLSSFINSDHPAGNVYLRIRSDTAFDNFKITLLNP